MNLRQAQRTLAELISKCEAAHIDLPKDPLEACAEAVETIIHSLKDGKPNLQEAQEELRQKYGIEMVWKQKMENEEAKRQRRRQSRQKKGASRSQSSTSIGSLPEAPAVDNSIETKASSLPGENGGAIHGRKKNIPMSGVMTPSKRSATSQEVPNTAVNVAKKARTARELTVPGSPSDTEDKPPPPRSAAALGNILSEDNHDESTSNGSPDQGIVDLLELEDLDEVERASEMSSDDEFTLLGR